MTNEFNYDVFLSHSVKDKPIVHELAERLQNDGLRVWLDEWVLKPGDHVQAKIEEGLEQSRVLVFCMSANAFGSEWAQLESNTFRFRDPLNRERRFIPLRLDDAPIKGSLAQFLYINWLLDDREQEYIKLVEACRMPVHPIGSAESARKQAAEKVIQFNSKTRIFSYAFSPDGINAISGGDNGILWLWDMETGKYRRAIKAQEGGILSVAWSNDYCRALSGGFEDNAVRLWDVTKWRCIGIFKGHYSPIRSVAWSFDQHCALTGSLDRTIRLWDVASGHCLQVLKGHSDGVISVAWGPDQRHILSGSADETIRLWDAKTGHCLRVLEGHTGDVRSVAWSLDQRLALSASMDKTVRLWDVETGRCLRVLNGHSSRVLSVAWSPDQRFALSASSDKTLRLWDVETGYCLRVLEGHLDEVRSVAWGQNRPIAFSGDRNGGIRVWDLSESFAEAREAEVVSPSLPTAPEQVQYTNAKVLLVGESGAGKTGLSKRLALNNWQPSDSTIGAWATQWKLPVDSRDGFEREIWLWDFGGQADQRLIHQLYMDETALAILVFDGQKEDLFETLGQWDRDLTRASQKTFAKLLVAGRVDAGGLRVSRNQIESFVKERGYTQLLETSAKQDIGCEELKTAILNGIRWEDIPWRSSPLLFKRLKEEILLLKDTGRVLMRFNELRETLLLRLMEEKSSEIEHFTDDELKAVVSLLAGPGVVWELKFGSWVLLQPERINAYAQAVIQTIREDEHERGCLLEERVLNGNLTYLSSLERLPSDEERFVLLAMHQTLVERSLCLREPTEKGVLLVLPSYYRRERPDLVGHPAVLVSYQFNGFLDDIYATLVVRLHHTKPFDQDKLWRHAADFKTLTGKQLGVKMTRRAEGAGELEVYFDPTIELGEKIIFSKYIHEHLLQNANDVVRLRHYVCPHCGTSIGNREVAMERLETWLAQQPVDPGPAGKVKPWIGKSEAPTIICVKCEQRVPLWDELEQHFASAETKQRVRELRKQSAFILNRESNERVLVGEVISTVALAGQISREFNISDHGIDMEIEFVTDDGEMTGQKLYLQLKWFDSYKRHRQRDGSEEFAIKDEHYADYWISLALPVLLVIRTFSGEIRWMDVSEYLRSAGQPAKSIIFEGERFDVMNVRRWREKMLS